MEEIQKIIDAIESAVNGFQTQMPGLQKRAFNELQNQVTRLENRQGKILATVANLKLIGDIRNKLGRIVVNPEYTGHVQDFVNAFSKVEDLQNNYFGAFAAKFKPDKALAALRKITVDATINSLLGAGIEANVMDKVADILRQNITGAASVADLNNQLRDYMTTNETGDGAMTRYSSQITTDALNQYSAQYHQAAAGSLGFQWGRYVGSNIKTSREFCIYLTQKEWIHVSELPEILKGNIDGHSCKLSKTTGLPLGMIPGTNAGNFQTYRGGYNCGHQYMMVPDSAVPPQEKQRLARLLAPPQPVKDALQTNWFAKKESAIKKNFDESTLKKLEATGLNYETLVGLTGGIPKDGLTGIAHNLSIGTEDIESHIKTDQYDIVRSIYYRDKWIYNELMVVKEKGGGIGLNLFLNQVIEARKAGFKYLKVSAAGNYAQMKDWNGYITWAKFGYEMESYSQEAFDNLMVRHGRTDKNVFDLIQTDEGLRFWEKYGSGWSGKFYLQDDSPTMKNLQKYLKDRNINVQL